MCLQCKVAVALVCITSKCLVKVETTEGKWPRFIRDLGRLSTEETTLMEMLQGHLLLVTGLSIAFAFYCKNRYTRPE